MAKAGLYANIHAKRKRIKAQKKKKKAGKNVKVEKMRKVGSKGAPAKGAFKRIRNG
jgi:hypothetical protein|tara:strand:+ start:2950 stop:3117 length:168 start_codon:yes stop_codon:yes gene_type:complete